MTTTSTNKDLLITRIFDAPRERVWKAWTDPDEVKKWWGPKHFTAPAVQIDFHPGGKYLFCMRGAAGPDMPVRDYWSTGVYKEIVPFEKLVMTDSFSDEHGNVVPANDYGMPGEDWQLEMLVTVTLKEHDGKTVLTLRHEGLPEGQVREMTEAGWNESLDKLDESVR